MLRIFFLLRTHWPESSHIAEMARFPCTKAVFQWKKKKKHASPFWLEEFLLKDQLLSLWVFPCVLFVVFPLLLLIFVLCV